MRTKGGIGHWSRRVVSLRVMYPVASPRLTPPHDPDDIFGGLIASLLLAPSHFWLRMS